MLHLQTNDAQNYFTFLSHVCKTFTHLANHMAPLKPCSHWQQLAATNQAEVIHFQWEAVISSDMRVSGRWQSDTACPTSWSLEKLNFMQMSSNIMHQAHMSWIYCYFELSDCNICLCSHKITNSQESSTFGVSLICTLKIFILHYVLL